MRIVITECDHDAFDAETTAARTAGAELVITQSRGTSEILENAHSADGILVQYATISGEIMDSLPSLRVISRYGVGVDSIDVEAATERGIAVCNVPDYGSEAVSDHAIGLALSVARGIPRLDRGVRAGHFDLPAVRPLYQTRSRIFGVVGLGRIGSATARKAAGLGYEVICYEEGTSSGTKSHRGFKCVSFDELIERSQVISLHTPLNTETRHMIGADEISRMRSDAILVNTSRGGTVDTDALVNGLRQGQLAGAGIDVHEAEPLPAAHPLTTFDNVVLTPHLAWYTEESYAELKRRTAENALEFLGGRTPRNILNPEILEAAGREVDQISARL